MAKPKFESLERFARHLGPQPLEGLTERLVEVMKACGGLRCRASERAGHCRAASAPRADAHLSHPTAYYASDVAFHQKIAQVSGNAVFVWFNAMVVKVMAEAWRKRAPSSKKLGQRP